MLDMSRMSNTALVRSQDPSRSISLKRYDFKLVESFIVTTLAYFL